MAGDLSTAAESAGESAKAAVAEQESVETGSYEPSSQFIEPGFDPQVTTFAMGGGEGARDPNLPEMLADAMIQRVMIDRLRYTVCNAPEADLVGHPEQWPGLCSWDIHDNGGEPVWGEVVDREAYWREKRKDKNEDESEAELIEMATVKYPIELAKLPKFEKLSDEAYPAHPRHLRREPAKLRMLWLVQSLSHRRQCQEPKNSYRIWGLALFVAKFSSFLWLAGVLQVAGSAREACLGG